MTEAGFYDLRLRSQDGGEGYKIQRIAGSNLPGFGREANVSPLPMLWGDLSRLPVVGHRFRPLARATAVCHNSRGDAASG